MAPTRSWILMSGWSCNTFFGLIISHGIPITLPQNIRNTMSFVLQESWCTLKLSCISCSYVLQWWSNALQRDQSVLSLSQWNRACLHVPYDNDQSQVRFGQDLEFLSISDSLLLYNCRLVASTTQEIPHPQITLNIYELEIKNCVRTFQKSNSIFNCVLSTSYNPVYNHPPLNFTQQLLKEREVTSQKGI